jgi:U3 small nucleolar RNA-associated protein 21
VPFVSLPLGKETFQITTCIGSSLQTYDLKRGLHLLFITSPRTPGTITATAVWERRLLAAWNEDDQVGVWLFQRGKKVAELEIPQGLAEQISTLIIFGSWIIGCCESRIEVWKSSTLEHYTTLYSRTASRGGRFSGSLCSVPTYLNKIFAGKNDGGVEIWNVKTAKLIYTILPSADYGAVTALQPAPALSLLAIAYKSGPVIIQNVRTDEPVLAVNIDTESSFPVTSITFRTDGSGAGEDGRKDGVMATASKDTGDITFWDLNGRGRKTGTLRGAHSPPSASGDVAGGITKIEFLPGQSVLLSSGLDNALKSWIFDDTSFSPLPRILHSRGGHAGPVSMLTFLPTNSEGAEAEGKWLLSSSKDRSLWAWSLRRDAQSTELSQGNIRHKAKKYGLLNSGIASSTRGTILEDLKAPEIICMACCLNRDGGMGTMPGTNAIWTNDTSKKNKEDTTSSSSTGWESIITGHKGDKFARTWFWGRKRAGRWKFATNDGTEVTSVAMSPCGTFALIGSSGGAIDMYNLQSGIHRQRYPTKLTPSQSAHQATEKAGLSTHIAVHVPKKFFRGEGKHTKAVTGIVVDSLNKTVISCGEDGKVKFWDFSSGLLLFELDWSLTSIRSIRFHRQSDLIAMACDDGSVRVVDIETKKLVRELWGAKGRILDFTFSNDGYWIVTVSSDSVIRVHDLSTNHLIEALRFRSQPIAVGFSSTGEYLATAHEDSLGVNLWTNRTLFTHVPTRQIGPDDIIDMDMPTASGDGGQGLIDDVFAQDVIQEETENDTPSSIDQLSADLLTLSLVPKARWQTLLNLDIIRSRNKPTEPPKKPQAAPFFLPSLESNTNDSQSLAILSPTNHTTAVSRISSIADPQAAAATTMTSLLGSFTTGQDPSIISEYLANLPPSAADLSIRTLDPAPPYTEQVAFVEALTARLRQRRDYELVQTWMTVFLRCHADVIVESESLRAALLEWREESSRESKRIAELMGYVKGVMGWVGGVV